MIFPGFLVVVVECAEHPLIIMQINATILITSKTDKTTMPILIFLPFLFIRIDFFKFMFDTIWTVQSAYFGNESRPLLKDVVEKNRGNSQITSQIINDEGTTYLSLVDNFPFFSAVCDTPEISKKLLSEKNFGEFFSLLASEDGMKAILFTQSATETSQYTADMIAKKIGITLESFLEIEPLLVKYGLLNEDSLTLDDSIIKVYHKWSNPEIRPLLMMAYQFINARQCYYDFTCNRTKPYFEGI